jgi:hypothetical protein
VVTEEVDAGQLSMNESVFTLPDPNSYSQSNVHGYAALLKLKEIAHR